MSQEKKSKIVFESTITCPYCEKEVNIKKIKTLVQEAVPAEYDEEIKVEKNLQTGLEDYKKED